MQSWRAAEPLCIFVVILLHLSQLDDDVDGRLAVGFML